MDQWEWVCVRPNKNKRKDKAESKEVQKWNKNFWFE